MILKIFSWRTPSTFDFQQPAVYFPAMSREICKSTFSRMNSGFGLELSGVCNSGLYISTIRQDLSTQNVSDGVNTPSGPRESILNRHKELVLTLSIWLKMVRKQTSLFCWLRRGGDDHCGAVTGLAGCTLLASVAFCSSISLVALGAFAASCTLAAGYACRACGAGDRNVDDGGLLVTSSEG